MESDQIVIVVGILGVLMVGILILYIKTLGTKNEFEKRVNELQSKYGSIVDVDKAVEESKSKLDSLNSKSAELSSKYKLSKTIYDKLEAEIKVFKDDLELAEFGVYQPHFEFETSEEFKKNILSNKSRQKDLISDGQAAICNTNWQVGNSTTKGAAMTKRGIKLTLRAFNGECDAAIAKVKWNNAELSERRIQKAFEAINRLNKSTDIHLTKEFLRLKFDELRLNHEYNLKRYEEKEEQRRIREQMREEEKALREIEKARVEAEKEEERYVKALRKEEEQVKDAHGEKLEKLNKQLEQLNIELQRAKEAKERALSRAQLTKSGHVYIISNVGSFGENIFKIGMTRRLEPLDRVKELGDASVPFRFDVHT